MYATLSGLECHPCQTPREFGLSWIWGEVEGTTLISGFPGKDRVDLSVGYKANLSAVMEIQEQI